MELFVSFIPTVLSVDKGAGFATEPLAFTGLHSIEENIWEI
jgi:hypothetical protein